MAWKDLPYLAAAAFAAIWFRLFSRGGDQARSMERSAKRRQGEQARSMERSAKRRRTGGNDGTAGGASSTHTSTEGQEVDNSSGYDYEVFLSFRGPDTRAGFTDFLYTNLTDAGIRTFKDDEDLRKGVEFAPELLQAIKQSKILIPIFSKDYASSVWCLKEVVQMVKCKKNGGKMIMPIFYDVAPSEVRYQTGNYKNSFLLYESKGRYDQKTIGEWKDALCQVGEINGWELPRDPTSRQESKFVKEFTQKIFNELKKVSLALSDNLVSVDHHVEEIMEKIGAQTSETWIIGIHGMGGIGKTTLAKIVYNQLSEKFDNCCFLVNIREQAKPNNGIISLQKKLILEVLKKKLINIRDVHEGIQTIRKELSNKKVLVVLDDVDHNKHMDALVGNHDWFGKGSKLIITTRKKEVLKVPEVDDLYEVDMMDSEKSLQLFSKHAFRRDYPLDKDIHQSMRAIQIARGLPLALEVMGSLLARIEKEKWDVKLKQLKEIPPEDVQSKLKISYDELTDREKDIFLDIACFLIGYDKDIIVHFWESKFHPECAMDVLESMSLIKIKEGNKVWMHDQLRDLGREIVHQESKLKIEEQSRVWDPEEALGLLRRQEEKKKLEALRLPLDHQHCFAYEDFKRLPNLKFLEVCNSNETSRNESLSSVLPTDVFQENLDLLPELRWLAWPNIPPTFKIMNFSMKNVVILDLFNSRITHDWEGWSHMKVMKNLKVMKLASCLCLERTPDFSANSKLERLILSFCNNLVEIDVSICRLKSLVFLDVSFCINLQRLPDELGRDLTSLKYLGLHCCYSLERLPNTIGNLESLNKLEIVSTSINKLPDSIGNLESLIELDISSRTIKELPDSIGQLENLKVVKIKGALGKILDALWTIEKLEVIDAYSHDGFDVEIGNCTYTNRPLRILRLKNGRIYKVPRLPESLIILELHKLYMDTFPDLSNLANLKKLELRFVRRDSDGEFDGESDGLVEEDLTPLRIENLSKLESLELTAPFVTTIPTNIRSLLPQLKSLELQCPNLRCLPSLPSSLSYLYLSSKCVTTLPMDMSLLPRLQSLRLSCSNLRCLPSLPSSLSSLSLYSCKSCCSMEDLSNLKTLSDLYISGCVISEIPALDHLENLEELRLKELQQLKIIPDLSNLNKLTSLMVSDCGNLIEIHGDFPPSLEALMIFECGSLQKLPDLSSLKGLEGVDIDGCRKLNVVYLSNLKTLKYLTIGDSAISEIRGLNHLENLQELRLGKLQQVEILPDLSNLNKLELLDVSDCGNLVEIQGNFPPSLDLFSIWDCGSLQKLPNLSSLEGLKSVVLKGCGKLNVEAISSLCSEKGVEFTGDETNQREESTNLDLNLKL